MSTLQKGIPSMLNVSCPRCGEPMEVPADRAGEVEQCPVCHCDARIPPGAVITEESPTVSAAMTIFRWIIFLPAGLGCGLGVGWVTDRLVVGMLFPWSGLELAVIAAGAVISGMVGVSVGTFVAPSRNYAVTAFILGYLLCAAVVSGAGAAWTGDYALLIPPAGVAVGASLMALVEYSVGNGNWTSIIARMFAWACPR